MDKPTVSIYLSRLERELAPHQWSALFHSLPVALQLRIHKYRFWQDRHRALFGKLLLRQALIDHQLSAQLLGELTYTAYGRPQLDVELDFNISHAGEYVLCAAGQACRLGVDVEQVKEVDLRDFHRVMTPAQWQLIHQAKEPMRMFYRLWTLKESVIKANGKGLSIPLDQLETDFNTVLVEEDTWHLTELSIDEQHYGYLACDLPEVQVEMVPLSF